MPTEREGSPRPPTDPVSSPEPVVRVTRGLAGPEELAAITTILLSRVAQGRPEDGALTPHRAPAWCRPHPRNHFRAPHSWQNTLL
ncbi:acyl-CoA carboxylase subunit epsilon [Streptomyces sp. NPDC001668]|uniref:acyl-CoA carboxylase subunit epsilon n=1 Tax=unclassified Streptomyces TaxID=2593676 RepID=UPI0033D4D425